MAAKGDTFSSDLLKLIFQAAAIANLADNASAGPLANLYMSLHTGDPGSGGNQSTSEISYTGYSRVAIARSTVGWTVIGTSALTTTDTVFGTPTGSIGQVITYVVIGTASAGAGKLLYRAPLSAPIIVELSNPPVVQAGTSFTES